MKYYESKVIADALFETEDTRDKFDLLINCKDFYLNKVKQYAKYIDINSYAKLVDLTLEEDCTLVVKPLSLYFIVKSSADYFAIELVDMLDVNDSCVELEIIEYLQKKLKEFEKDIDNLLKIKVEK